MTRALPCGVLLLATALLTGACTVRDSARNERSGPASVASSANAGTDVPLPPGATGPMSLARADGETSREFWVVFSRATQEKQAGRWDAAAREYRRALALDPTHWDALYYLGNCLIEQGRFQDAYEAYRRLSKSDAQAARAYSALGSVHSNPRAGALFDLEKAEFEYTRAARANGDETGSILRLGEVAVATGKIDRAREYLSAVSRTNAKSVSARFLLGYLAWQEGDRSEAIALLREAAQLKKVQKPPVEASGEGDTKLPGHQAMTAPGSRGMFDGFTAGLRADQPIGDAYVDSLYRRVREFIANLPKPSSS